METTEILSDLQQHYPVHCTEITFFRDGGSLSYTVHAEEKEYFLRVIRPELMDTALQSVDIQLYLDSRGFPTPSIILTKDGQPYVRKMADGKPHLYILYEHLGEGSEPGDEDAERVGSLIGKLHSIMADYPKPLKQRDKQFFIGRYLDILRAKNHPLLEAYTAYGIKLWEKVRDLPGGYCHCDLYPGNVFKATDGQLYVLDFDTSCNAFPMYDATLYCNKTDYFEYSDEGFERSVATLGHFLKGYQTQRTLSEEEIRAYFFFHCIYHYQLQATIVEIYGIDCNEADFEEKQMNWMLRFLEKARASEDIVL